MVRSVGFGALVTALSLALGVLGAHPVAMASSSQQLTGTYLWSAAVTGDVLTQRPPSDDVVLLTILQTSPRFVAGNTVDLEGTWAETTSDSSPGIATVGNGGGPPSSHSFAISGDGDPGGFWFTVENQDKLTFQAKLVGRSVVADFTPPGGGLQALTFLPTPGLPQYDADVDLFDTVAAFNLTGGFGETCVPLETFPFSVGGQQLAVATFISRLKHPPGASQDGPVISVLTEQTGGSWQPTVTLDSSGLTCPSVLVTSDTLIPGAKAFGFSYPPSAGSNSAGNLLSNTGGRWHLVDFILPPGLGGPKPVTTTGLSNPDYGQHTVTLSDSWLVGQCSQSARFGFSRARGAFVSIGKVVDHYPVKQCSP